MGFSLGNIVKGVVTGVETLAETGNPIAAAGAGAVTAFSGGGASTSTAATPTFDPLLDEMSGNLNAGSPPQIYSYMQLAGLDSNGNSQQNADFGSIVDGSDDSDGDGGYDALVS